MDTGNYLCRRKMWNQKCTSQLDRIRGRNADKSFLFAADAPGLATERCDDLSLAVLLAFALGISL
jgi:hypothetical protein